jgi:sodium-dependent dicarboxylate transporter 2/3/5
MTRRAGIGLVLGPALFLAVQLSPVPTGLTPAAWQVAGLALWMAAWWLTEALPLAVTALLPLLVLPWLGTAAIKAVAPAYANPVIFLFLGGFLLAAAVERWGLHRRIALHLVHLLGLRPDRLVLGFMLATALLSMWVSNTATVMMMVAIGMAVAKQTSGAQQQTGTALMLGIAYAASIGGVATLIGTPPNAILAGVARSTLGLEIGFAQWLAFALPLAAVLLLLTWWLLTHVLFRTPSDCCLGGAAELRAARAALGPLSRQERRVLLVFVLVAAAWVLRGFVAWGPLERLDDAGIALTGALLLFALPDGAGGRLLDWPTAARIPWDILVLFGGGFALAQAFADSGLTAAVAGQLSLLRGVDPLWLIGGVSLLVVLLTEITSNTATATLLLPLMAGLAAAVQVHPLLLMVPAAVAASFAFMLPVATPPNAIVFGSRQVSIGQMARAGLLLNLAGTLLLTLFAYFWLPLVFELAAG